MGMTWSRVGDGLQVLPASEDIAGLGHVGHGAAGGQVGEDDPLVVGAEDVSALGHEMDAAEDDVVRLRPGGGELGQLE
jgi:hypothetical protein